MGKYLTKILGIILLSASLNGHAAEMMGVFSDGTAVTVTDAKCDVPVAIEKAGDGYGLGSVAFPSGLTRRLCWSLVDDEICIVDDTGFHIHLPMAPFKQKETI